MFFFLNVSSTKMHLWNWNFKTEGSFTFDFGKFQKPIIPITEAMLFVFLFRLFFPPKSQGSLKVLILKIWSWYLALFALQIFFFKCLKSEKEIILTRLTFYSTLFHSNYFYLRMYYINLAEFNIETHNPCAM